MPDTVTVRYIVNDVDAAVDFYSGCLDFHVQLNSSPAFALLAQGPLRLALSAPGGPGGGGQPMPDGTYPRPGGWNRIVVAVDDIEAAIEPLRAKGVPFRNNIVTGVSGRQILIEDPAGNPVELFQAIA